MYPHPWGGCPPLERRCRGRNGAVAQRLAPKQLERQINIIVRNLVAGRFSSPYSLTATIAALPQELDILHDSLGIRRH